jgi:hypothetical protein
MLDAAGNAWSGMRVATVDVMQYQYGNEVASVAADSADVVEGVANMGVAMRYAQPTQVRCGGFLVKSRANTNVLLLICDYFAAADLPAGLRLVCD